LIWCWGRGEARRGAAELGAWPSAGYLARGIALAACSASTGGCPVALFHRVMGWVWVALTAASALALCWELTFGPLTQVGPQITVVLLALAAYSAWGHLREARGLAQKERDRAALLDNLRRERS
jgi:hypothetical protein